MSILAGFETLTMTSGAPRTTRASRALSAALIDVACELAFPVALDAEEPADLSLNPSSC
ncbi:hypothetical protein [Roseobacter litoralis]|uniref:hypothetical protein n=1 Tax=Roseobacter litoralis TaxID=42443 RepID=UPI00249511A5|nr:hypothetical protein [Roseobacter litoralis]